MTKFYVRFQATFRIIMAGMLLLFYSNVAAQGPTLLSIGDCGVVSQNFNTVNGGFSSQSLYSPANYKQFIYTPGIGYWNMMGPSNAGIWVGAPVSAYNVSIISPVYFNPNPAGFIDIGFYYEVPNAAVDAYQIRIFDVRETGGLTQFNLIANTDERPFSSSGTGTAPNSGPLCVRVQDEDITNTTPYRIEITYLIREGGNATFDNFSLGRTTEQPLPVNFLSITANKTNDGVIVRWEVGEEQNVARYEIERSENGRNFIAVGTAAAAAQVGYSFTDVTPLNGVNFYRIKNVDTDGRFKYSSSVKVNLSRAVTLNAYPLPARAEIILEHKFITSKSLICLTAMDGKVVSNWYALPGTNRTVVHLYGLHSGVYLLSLYGAKGGVETLKIVKL